jgi:hypothetical protein
MKAIMCMIMEMVVESSGGTLVMAASVRSLYDGGL